MNVAFDRRFLKDIRNLKESSVKKNVQSFIEQVEQADALHDISQIKKLKGYDDHYRGRIQNYRIGLFIEQDVVWFVRLLHRREIYRYFP